MADAMAYATRRGLGVKAVGRRRECGSTRRCLFRTLGGAWPLQQAAGLAKRLLWREPAESGPGFVDVRDGMRVLGGAAHHLKERDDKKRIAVRL